MKAARFIPWLEQLENRFLLSVLGDSIPVLDELGISHQHAHVADSGETNFVDMEFTVESQGDGAERTLIMRVSTPDMPHQFRIVGGESAWTDRFGNARLPQPTGVESLDVMVSDDVGLTIGIIRLHFDSLGNITEQMFDPNSGSGDHGDMSGMVLPTDAFAAHSAHNMPSILTMADPSVEHSEMMLEPQSVDSVMEGHHSMSGGATGSYVPSPGHGSSHDAAQQDSMDALAESHQSAELRELAEHGEMASPASAHAEPIPVTDEAPVGEETFESLAANWTDGSSLEFLPAEASPTQIEGTAPTDVLISWMGMKPLALDEAVYAAPAPALVFADYRTPQVRGATEAATESSRLPQAGAIVVAVVASAGAVVLESRAMRKKAVRSTVAPRL